MAGQRRPPQISENESLLYQQTCPRRTAEGTSLNKVTAEGTLGHPGGKHEKQRHSDCEERPSPELPKACWAESYTMMRSSVYAEGIFKVMIKTGES